MYRRRRVCQGSNTILCLIRLGLTDLFLSVHQGCRIDYLIMLGIDFFDKVALALDYSA